ncbi:MAG: FtsQ-type POTRA domain-containing protein [Acidobacteria bacterium]|nr:FtsQ-type POTRA domain-containing protein [Acidobacteriota bacterium]
MIRRFGVMALGIGLGLMPPAASRALAQTSDIVSEIRIHGNYRTPDADVLALADVKVGGTIDSTGIEAIAERLRKSGRFESVEVRKRLRSLTATDQVSLIIVVEEYPSTDKGGGVPGPLRRIGDSVMLMPALDWADGYGLTYGGRISFVQVLGKQGRVTVPLTWGGTRQAAVELDTTVDGGPFKRLRAGGSLVSRNNPGFDVRDFRKSVWADVVTPAWKAVSLGLHGAWSDVTFGEERDRLATYGAGVIVDTRDNPAFPRNAIYASAWWNRLSPRAGAAVYRYRLEARGYLGLIGSTVLSVRAVSDTADRVLPDYEKALLGGIETLRGFRAGSFVGDNLSVASAELRIPLHSPMSVGQSGLTVFADAGAVYDHGVRLSDARRRYGVGVGWFVRAPLVQFGIDVAHGSGGGTRAHVTAGLRF